MTKPKYKKGIEYKVIKAHKATGLKKGDIHKFTPNEIEHISLEHFRKVGAKNDTFTVDVVVVIRGSMEVKAFSEAEALEKASPNLKDPHYGLDCPFVEYDYSIDNGED